MAFTENMFLKFRRSVSKIKSSWRIHTKIEYLLKSCRCSTMLVIIATALTLSSCSKQSNQHTIPPRPIAWAKAELHANEVIRILTGVTQPAQQAPLSFEVFGVVEQVWVDVGQRVTQGQVLAVLNSESKALKLRESKNSFNEAVIELKQAKIDLDRQQSLRSKKLNSQYQLDIAQLHYDQFVSRVAHLEAQLAQAEKDLRDTELRAPYSGLISKRLLEPGQQITIGEKVFHIEGDAGHEVTITIPEGLLNVLKIGSKHCIKIPAATADWLDSVVSEISTFPTHTNAYPATLTLTKTHLGVKGGMTAQVHLLLPELGNTTAEKPSAERSIANIRLSTHTSSSTTESNTDLLTAKRVSIPISALLMDSTNNTTVFRYEQSSSTIVAVPVTIGEFIEDRVEVTQGLQPGDIVASKGINHLRDGQAVSLMNVGVKRYNP